MADLGNSKIKDTYTLVLQTDASGNLQKLDGTTPTPFIVNGTLRYTVSPTDGYVLTSDASGNASWAEAGGTSYWSANTNGSISPSGLTTNIGLGTSTPNKPLTVVGDISGTTDLYLGNSSNTASTITAEEQLTIKGRGVDNDYLGLSQDKIEIHLDGTQYATFISNTHPSVGGGAQFNASSQEYDFDILGGDTTPIFQLAGASGENRIRIRDHLTIGKNAAISHADAVKWGLAVTGSSLFYSGGSSLTNTNAIEASGNISGTTNLYIDENMYSGTTNLLDIFASSAITNQDVYWSANTNGSISTSGGSTNLELGGDISLVDNGEILLGDGGDLSITHNSIKSIIKNTTGELLFENEATDADIRFKGDDDGSTITALTLDMSEAGAATFNSTVTSSSMYVDDYIYHNGNVDTYIGFPSGDKFSIHAGGVNFIKCWEKASPPSQLIINENQANLDTIFKSPGEGNLLKVDASEDRVGILTGAPAASLHVDGDFITTSHVNISGNTSYIGAISGTGSITTVGNLDVDGTSNLDNTDIDGTFTMDGTAFDVNGTTTVAIDNTNTTNGVTINTATSGSKVFIGHTTSETTVNDNLTVTGKITRNFVPSNVDVGDFNGDIIYTQDGDTIVTTAGALYQLSDGATWELAVADAVSTSTKLLGIALGSDSTSGFLVRGTVTLASSTGGSDGDVLYVSTTDGRLTATAPTASGSVVRAVGYVLVVSELKIWFNPDNTWVELS